MLYVEDFKKRGQVAIKITPQHFATCIWVKEYSHVAIPKVNWQKIDDVYLFILSFSNFHSNTDSRNAPYVPERTASKYPPTGEETNKAEHHEKRSSYTANVCIVNSYT